MLSDAQPVGSGAWKGLRLLTPKSVQIDCHHSQECLLVWKPSSSLCLLVFSQRWREPLLRKCKTCFVRSRRSQQAVWWLLLLGWRPLSSRSASWCEAIAVADPGLSWRWGGLFGDRCVASRVGLLTSVGAPRQKMCEAWFLSIFAKLDAFLPDKHLLWRFALLIRVRGLASVWYFPLGVAYLALTTCLPCCFSVPVSVRNRLTQRLATAWFWNSKTLCFLLSFDLSMSILAKTCLTWSFLKLGSSCWTVATKFLWFLPDGMPWRGLGWL